MDPNPPPNPPSPSPTAPTLRAVPAPDAPTVVASPGAAVGGAGSPPPSPGGDRFGKFVRTRKLGAGGMGEVWQAWDGELSRWVALKLLKGTDAEEIARFKREAQTAARLSHPNIAAVFDVGEEGGRHWIAMQFVDGQTLKTFPRGDRRLLARLMRDAARAVHFAHGQGVVHRDLKPDNLMATGEGDAAHVFVMDFGLARATEGASNLSVTGQILGTPNYMPPEQAHGERVDVRADVYSLGATMYELLTDKRPFAGENVYATLRKVMDEEPEPPRRADPRVDADLETIVLKCLEKERSRRYATAAELADDLDRFLRNEPISARPASVLYRARKFVRRRASLVTAGAVLACGVAYGLYALLWPAAVAVTSEPAGAEIVVDGRATGRRTPASVRVWPPGRVVVEARLEGHDGPPQARDLRAGQTAEVAVALTPTHGTLSVASKPGGADAILVAGGVETPLGRTPVTGARAPRGPAKLVLKRAGYPDDESLVDVPPGRPVAVERVLTPLSGTVHIESHQPGLAVRYEPLDRSDVEGGHRPLPAAALPLAAGRWRLTFEGEGFVTRAREVTVEAGRERWIQGWAPPAIAWSAELPAEAAAIAVADFNRDGRLDVVGRCADARAHAVSGRDGALLWSAPDMLGDSGEPFPEPPHLADLDGDAVPDVVLVTPNLLRACSGRDGGLLWEAAPTPWIGVGTALADVNGDGVPDAVCVGEGQVAAASGRDGRTLWRATPGEEIVGIVAVADFNADGVPDFALAGQRVVACSGADGSKLWLGEADEPDVRGAATAELDGDGVPDVVVGTLATGLYALSGATGRQLWQNEALTSVSSRVWATDANADGVTDFVALAFKALVTVSGDDGRLLWQQPCDRGLESYSDLELVDLDGDGVRDAVVGPVGGALLAFRGRDGEPFPEIRPGFDALTVPVGAGMDGDELPELVVADLGKRVAGVAAVDAGVAWEAAIAETFDVQDFGSDVDGDGVKEVVWVTFSGEVRVASGATGDRIWGTDLEAPADLPFALGDLDRDGFPEVLVQIRPVADAPACVIVLDGRTGEDQEPFDGGSLDGPWPLRSDLDGDGRFESVAWDTTGTLGAVYPGSGKAGRFVKVGLVAASSPVLADTDGDRIPDVIGFAVKDALVLAGFDGTVRWKVPGLCETPLRPADLDGDRFPDFLADERRLHVALSGRDGRRLWERARAEGATALPFIADLDGDGAADLIVNEVETLVAIAGRDGRELWRQRVSRWADVLATVPAGKGVDAIVATDRALRRLDGRTGATLWVLAGTASDQHQVAVGRDLLAASTVGAGREAGIRRVRASDGAVLERRTFEGYMAAPPLRVDLPGGRALALAVVSPPGIRALRLTPNADPPAPEDAAEFLRDALWRDPSGASLAAHAAPRLPVLRDKTARFLLLTGIAEALLDTGDRREAARALTALRDLGADSWLIRAGIARLENSTADIAAALRARPDAAARFLLAHRASWKGRRTTCRTAAATLAGLPRAAARLLADDYDLALADLAAAEAAGAPAGPARALRRLFPDAAAPYLARARAHKTPARRAALARLALARAGGETYAEAALLAAEALAKLGKKEEAAAVLDAALARTDLRESDRAAVGEARAKCR